MSIAVSPPLGDFPRFGYHRELPSFVAHRDEWWLRDWTEFLPETLVQTGYQLLRLMPRRWGQEDPWVLYDPWGEVVTEWERLPSLSDLLTAGANGQPTLRKEGGQECGF